VNCERAYEENEKERWRVRYWKQEQWHKPPRAPVKVVYVSHLFAQTMRELRGVQLTTLLRRWRKGEQPAQDAASVQAARALWLFCFLGILCASRTFVHCDLLFAFEKFSSRRNARMRVSTTLNHPRKQDFLCSATHWRLSVATSSILCQSWLYNLKTVSTATSTQFGVFFSIQQPPANMPRRRSASCGVTLCLDHMRDTMSSVLLTHPYREIH